MRCRTVANADPPISAANAAARSLSSNVAPLPRASRSASRRNAPGSIVSRSVSISAWVVAGMTNGSAYSDITPMMAPVRQYRTVSVRPSWARAWTLTSPRTTSSR
jgi:hypothetical protein